MTLEKVDDKTAYENLLVKYAELEDKIADIKANSDLAIEGRDVKIKELEQELTVQKDLLQEETNLHLHAEDYIKSLEEENAELKKKLKEKLKNIADKDLSFVAKFDALEKENAELKEQGDKWFVFETEAGNWGMDKATQYTVDRHNYFYGTKEECQKWGVEHKIKDYTGHKYCYDRLDNQLTKAKEIIKNLLILKKDQHGNTDIGWRVEVTEQAEQFLKEIEK